MVQIERLQDDAARLQEQLHKKEESIYDLQKSVEERQNMLQQSNTRIGELEEAQLQMSNQVHLQFNMFICPTVQTQNDYFYFWKSYLKSLYLTIVYYI